MIGISKINMSDHTLVPKRISNPVRTESGAVSTRMRMLAATIETTLGYVPEEGRADVRSQSCKSCKSCLTTKRRRQD